MKCYFLTELGIPYIKSADGRYLIPIGECGRGRELQVFRFDPNRAKFAPVEGHYGIRFWDTGIVEYTMPDEKPGEAMVFVPEMFGSRGTSRIVETYKCKELGKGKRANGLAGRVEWGEEYLMRVEEGGWFKVKVTGRKIGLIYRKFVNSNGKIIEV